MCRAALQMIIVIVAITLTVQNATSSRVAFVDGDLGLIEITPSELAALAGDSAPPIVSKCEGADLGLLLMHEQVGPDLDLYLHVHLLLTRPAPQHVAPRRDRLSHDNPPSVILTIPIQIAFAI